MKYTCTALTLALATMLSACATPGPDEPETTFGKDSYTPTGSMIPRRTAERAPKQEVIVGDDARNALDRLPQPIPGR